MQNPVPQLSVYNQFITGGHQLDIFSEKRRMLAMWCANIEKTVVNQEIGAMNVFAGFQHLEFFLPVLDRYKAMTSYVENIWIFGTAPKQQTLPDIKGINYVYLEDEDVLVQEWFLLVHHPLYSRSLSALETTEPGTPHSKRTYKGILSSDPKVIEPVFNNMLDKITTV